jgi:hypothetical protein
LAKDTWRFRARVLWCKRVLPLFLPYDFIVQNIIPRKRHLSVRLVNFKPSIPNPTPPVSLTPSPYCTGLCKTVFPVSDSKFVVSVRLKVLPNEEIESKRCLIVVHRLPLRGVSTDDVPRC